MVMVKKNSGTNDPVFNRTCCTVGSGTEQEENLCDEASGGRRDPGKLMEKVLESGERWGQIYLTIECDHNE